MRRPRVHRVMELPTTSVVFRSAGKPGDGMEAHQVFLFRTKCGMTGGASLMALGAIDRGSGHYCNQCWPGSRPIRKQRDVPRYGHYD